MDIGQKIKGSHFFSTQVVASRDSLGGPVAKTLCSQCREPRFDPCQGTKSYMPQLRVHMPQLKIWHAATKTQHSWIKEYKLKKKKKL